MDISETSMAVHYQYHDCLSKELIKHWKDLYNASDKLPDKFSDKFYGRLAGNYPWFGDMLFFWSDGTRMRLRRKVVVGHWTDEKVQDRIAVWERVAALHI